MVAFVGKLYKSLSQRLTPPTSPKSKAPTPEPIVFRPALPTPPSTPEPDAHFHDDCVSNDSEDRISIDSTIHDCDLEDFDQGISASYTDNDTLALPNLTRAEAARVERLGPPVLNLNRQVVRLVELIEEICDGTYSGSGDELWILNDLKPSEYKQLLQFIESTKKQTLRAFFHDKLR